jgi:hypothetical protein
MCVACHAARIDPSRSEPSMNPHARKPRTAIVPKTLMGVALTTAVPACALALASACSGDGARKDYTFVADVSAHFDAPDDRIFIADVSAHFDARPEPDAADAADALDDADAQEDAG